MRKQLEAREAAKPSKPVSSFAPVSTEPVISPTTATSTPAPIAEPAAPVMPPKVAAAALTALQKQVLGMPAVAQVIQVERDQGFVVVNAGKTKNSPRARSLMWRRATASWAVFPSPMSSKTPSPWPTSTRRSSCPVLRIEPGDELILPVTR